VGRTPRIPRQSIRLPAGRANAFVSGAGGRGYRLGVEHDERQEEREQEIKRHSDELERQGDELEERGNELEQRIDDARDEFEDKKRSGELPGGQSG
jgi:hypothetical protein